MTYFEIVKQVFNLLGAFKIIKPPFHSPHTHLCFPPCSSLLPLSLVFVSDNNRNNLIWQALVINQNVSLLVFILLAYNIKIQEWLNYSEVCALKTPFYRWGYVWNSLLNNNCSLLCCFHTFIAKTVAWTQPGKTHIQRLWQLLKFSWKDESMH